jgi:hypothetical protein
VSTGRIETPTASPLGHGWARATRIAFRPLPLLVALAAVAAFSAAPSANAATLRLDAPHLSDLAFGVGLARYTTVRSLRERVGGQPEYWGGDFTTAAGERVKLFVSRSYPENPALGQKWAEFIAGLVHGSELSLLTVYLDTPREVSGICGQDGLACYSAADSTLVAPGEDLEDVSMEALISHEYGHHVAAHRLNDPWRTVDWGTKRWATYESVCARTRAKQLFPGSESGRTYARNPGEGFAETYRVLNERRAGIPEAPWDIVSQIMYPDNAALAALQQDVQAPWTAATSSTLAGAFSAASKTRSYTIATPLDGTLSLNVHAPRTGRLTLSLFTGGKRVATATTSRPSAAAAVKTTICGARSYVARVTRVTGSGRYAVGASRP